MLLVRAGKLDTKSQPSSTDGTRKGTRIYSNGREMKRKEREREREREREM